MYQEFHPHSGKAVRVVSCYRMTHSENFHKCRRIKSDPYASWQKGAIENTNKLIRQYIPKHTNFDEVTDKKIASIQKKINSRLRKKLKFETPKTEFFKRIA